MGVAIMIVNIRAKRAPFFRRAPQSMAIECLLFIAGGSTVLVESSQPMDARPLADSRTASDNCDLCGSRSVRELYTATDRLRNSGLSFSVSRCEGCGVLRTLPVMSEGELSVYYPNDYWGEARPPSLAW